MAQTPAMAGTIDVVVPLGLTLAGLSLMLGLFTQLGAWSALAFLTLFYLAAIPTGGIPIAGAEGTYLLVNKTLVEWAAVLVIATFRTGELAGLDLLLARRADTVSARVTS
jgi:thiosulfate dehydrogenase [quinone] large subunit